MIKDFRRDLGLKRIKLYILYKMFDIKDETVDNFAECLSHYVNDERLNDLNLTLTSSCQGREFKN